MWLSARRKEFSGKYLARKVNQEVRKTFPTSHTLQVIISENL